MNLAIVLFHFRRINNLEQQLLALRTVKLPVYIFVDYDESCNGDNIRQFEKLIKQFKSDNPECSIEMFSQKTNMGLRNSILNGLNYVSERSDAFMVFEDDIQFNLDSIAYFTESLLEYDQTDVFHINGWCHPRWYPLTRKRYYFGKWAFCWGWATWSSKWALLQLDAEQLLTDLEPRRNEFNIFGSYRFTDQLDGNLDKSLVSWAVFWTATIFNQGGKCLNTSYPHCRPLEDDKYTNASNISAYKSQNISNTFVRSKLPGVNLPIDQKETMILFVYVRFVHRFFTVLERLKSRFTS
jgi:hypothetical protein